MFCNHVWSPGCQIDTGLKLAEWILQNVKGVEDLARKNTENKYHVVWIEKKVKIRKGRETDGQMQGSRV